MLKFSLNTTPEKAFAKAIVRGDSEIQNLLVEFDQVKEQQAAYPLVIALLRNTLNFRYANDPARLEDVAPTEAVVKKMERELQLMATHLQEAEDAKATLDSEKDKKILDDAIWYASRSIKSLVFDLASMPWFIPVWNQSTLKKYI